MTKQPAILLEHRPFARYLSGSVRTGASPDDVRAALAGLTIDDRIVVGIGPELAAALGAARPELRSFPAIDAEGANVPSTQDDLWLWIIDEEVGEPVLRGRELAAALADTFVFAPPVDAFKYGHTDSGRGRDLTGYEDGTENPTGEEAVAAGFATDGSSFVAVQTWRHDMAYFASLPGDEQDAMIGRRRSDNVELSDVPPSAHVKRTAQEDFEPEAFLVRRSLPWAGPDGEGLMFVGFGCSFDAFEAQMKRMCGLDDGIIDACFRFSEPVTGSYYWCPPTVDGRLVF